MSVGANMSDEMAQYSQTLRQAPISGDESGLKEQLKNLMGLDAESPYGHASKSIKLGQQAKEAMDAK
jgi:hypothetical protein